MRERARGLSALLAEKRRGLERELAAAADVGVVETLVADAGALRAELTAVERDTAELDARRRAVDGSGEPADPARLAVVEEALRAAERGWREAETEAGRWHARAEALDAERAAIDVAALAGIDGVAGSVLDHLEIEAGAEVAVAAALGDAMQAIVVDGHPAARQVVERIAAGDAQALLLVLDAHDTAVTTGATLAPAGSRALAACVRASLPGLQATLARLLAGIVLVDGDWRRAVDLALDNPDLTVMTARGDRFGGRLPWRLGGAPAAGITRAALDEAEQQQVRAAAARDEAEAAVVAARDDLDAVQGRVAAAAGVHRELEMRAATLAERRAVLTGRLAGVEDRLARDPEAKATAERYRSALVAKDQAYREVAERLDAQSGRIDDVLERLREERRRQTERASAAGGQLEALRTERSGLEGDLAGVRERQQRREIDEAENRMRLEAVVERIRTDFDCEPAVALDAPAPEVPEGTTRAGRARDLERELRLMGPINPLALEEYDALLERHDFLQQQLEDVKNSRRELQRVIKAVDKEIVTVFEAAFTDVQENFEQLFTTLFPGGSGRIFLTDPGDLLNTGIEMEARPSGKNTRRLSLLSGGERSLTAMAFLFAVFRARPSPFYLLDEVEAALDDVNLHRFLDLVHEFRNEAQLVIVSHQKRTMEAGDCLYGVSMAPGASSRVVSQRIRDEVVLT
jgi:chromosome segregation protein